MQEKIHIPETEIIAIILFNKLSPLYCTNRQNKCKNSRMGKSRLVGYASGVVASCCLLIVFGSVCLSCALAIAFHSFVWWTLLHEIIYLHVLVSFNHFLGYDVLLGLPV